jgi:hypothetical protein
VLRNITHNNNTILDSNITHDINNNKLIDNNVPTQLCEIDFLDIDDQDLLSAFDDIEIQQYGVSSGNTNDRNLMMMMISVLDYPSTLSWISIALAQ